MPHGKARLHAFTLINETCPGMFLNTEASWHMGLHSEWGLCLLEMVLGHYNS